MSRSAQITGGVLGVLGGLCGTLDYFLPWVTYHGSFGEGLRDYTTTGLEFVHGLPLDQAFNPNQLTGAVFALLPVPLAVFGLIFGVRALWRATSPGSIDILLGNRSVTIWLGVASAFAVLSALWAIFVLDPFGTNPIDRGLSRYDAPPTIGPGFWLQWIALPCCILGYVILARSAAAPTRVPAIPSVAS